MNQRSNVMFSSQLKYILFVVALFTACGPILAADAPAQTPEQVFLAAQHATQRHDWGTFFDLLTESTRNNANAMSLSTGLMIESLAPQGDEKLKNMAAEFEKVRLHHGLDAKRLEKLHSLDPSKPEAADEVRRLAKELKDQRRFFIDSATALLPMMTALPLADGKLTGLKIEGDAAHGGICIHSKRRRRANHPPRLQ
jgi:hypothetical protein